MKRLFSKFICSIIGHRSGDKKHGYGCKLVEYAHNHWEGYSECPRCGAITRELMVGTYPGSRHIIDTRVVKEVPLDYIQKPNGFKIKITSI